ncbi:uncharacterized protein LOC144153220 [Haemaphysalis longicornis]
MDGNLGCRTLATASEPGHAVSRLFYITDKVAGHRFLVDTGAEWLFTIGDIKQPTLGAGFLGFYSLDVDVHSRRLADMTTTLSVRGVLSTATATGLRAFVPSSVYEKILADFPAITRPHTGQSPVKHTITHHIAKKGPLVFGRARRLAGLRYAIARREFKPMLELRIVRPSSSNYASAQHMVPIKNPGEWRPCGDYRALNAITMPARYLLPHLQNFTANLAGCNIFSKAIEFLGLLVTPQGIRPLDTEVKAIQNFPQPTSIKNLR